MIAALAALRAGLDPRGRLSRHAYGRRVVGAILAVAALGCLAVVLAASGFRIAAFLVLAGMIPVAAACVAWTARRLHDRDRTAWWLGPYAAASLASFAPIETLADRDPAAVIVATLAMIGFGLWFTVETLGRRGTPGPNRHGPEPEPPPWVSQAGPSP